MTKQLHTRASRYQDPDYHAHALRQAMIRLAIGVALALAGTYGLCSGHPTPGVLTISLATCFGLGATFSLGRATGYADRSQARDL